MAYYYVKNGGTATGDAGRYASQQTGSFATLGAANYYNDIAAAIAATTAPVAGDFINPSDLHSFSTASSITYTGLTPPYFDIICVDDANIGQPRTSGNRGSEATTGSAPDINLNNVFFSGITLSSGDTITAANNCKLIDSELIINGSSNRFLTSGDGAAVNLIGCDVVFDQASSSFSISGGGNLTIVGGAVTTNAVSLNSFLSGGATAGGLDCFVYGVDLSSISGTILDSVGGSTAEDSINCAFDMCKLASGVSFDNEDFKRINQRALFTRCSDASAAAEYQYHLHAFGGDVDDDTTIYRNEDEPFTESNQKISYKVVTNSDASLGSPLWLDFPISRYSELSAGATDVLSFYITSATALTDKDIYIEVSYPDGTNKQTPNFISTGPLTVGGTIDLMATGTTLTTDATSTWTGALANLYQIDVSTAGDPGSDCQPTIKVYITKPSTTFYIASEYGLS